MSGLTDRQELRQIARSVVHGLRRLRRHGSLRIPSDRSIDVAVKPAPYLPVYEELLSHLRLRRFSLLELGVWKGDSLALWRDAFPRARIIGLDLAPPPLDLGPRVTVVTGDQTDAQLLGKIRAKHAPEGFDVIIDDASHIGQLSARSLQALYSDHLKPGGFYVIEDWGTGYLPTWPDGADPATAIGVSHLDQSLTPEADASTTASQRLPSHDAGMVGLVKRLVDHIAAVTLSVHQPSQLQAPLRIEWMRIHDGLVILKKPSD